MQKIKKFIPVGLILTPFLAMADANIPQIINDMIHYLNLLIPLVIGIAVVVFLFGVVKYITSGADETKRKEARSVMIFGIIGIFVMISIWGLVNILISTFNLNTNAPVNIPAVPNALP